MRLLQLCAVTLGLMTSVQAYQVTFYDKKNCNNEESKPAETYLIYEGNDSSCINVGDKPGRGGTCSRYENKGNNPKKECGDPFTAGSSQIYTQKTQIFGAERIWRCKFYGDHDCREGSESIWPRKPCKNDGTKSFKCGPDEDDIGDN